MKIDIKHLDTALADIVINSVNAAHTELAERIDRYLQRCTGLLAVRPRLEQSHRDAQILESFVRMLEGQSPDELWERILIADECFSEIQAGLPVWWPRLAGGSL